jgi:hypothetical protein
VAILGLNHHRSATINIIGKSEKGEGKREDKRGENAGIMQRLKKIYYLNSSLGSLVCFIMY